MSVVLNKAKSTRRFVKAVQAHDQSLDAATFAKQLVNLLLSRVEREIAHIQGGRNLQLVFRLGLQLVLIVLVVVSPSSFVLLPNYQLLIERIACVSTYLGGCVRARSIEPLDSVCHAKLRHCVLLLSMNVSRSCDREYWKLAVA